MNVSRSEFLATLAAVGAFGAAAPAQAARPPWFPLPPPLQPSLRAKALVLSGAGARGAYEAGVLKWLFKDIDGSGAPYDVICGTSAGAINAAFAARATGASIAQTASLWLGMPQANVMELVPPVQHGVNAAAQFQESTKHGYPRKLSYLSRANGEIKAMGPPDQLADLMGVVNDANIEALVKKYPLSLSEIKTSLIVTATNVTRYSSDSFYAFRGANSAAREDHFVRSFALTSVSGRSAVLRAGGGRYRLTDDNLTNAVLASTSVPGVFNPTTVSIAEHGTSDLFVDGGVANNTPISLAVDAGAFDVTVVMADAPGEGLGKPAGNLKDVLQGSFRIMQRELLEGDIRYSLAKNVLAKRHDISGLSPTMTEALKAMHVTDWTPITLRIIRPAEPLKLTSLGFNDGPGLQAAFDAGYADAQNPTVFAT